MVAYVLVLALLADGGRLQPAQCVFGRVLRVWRGMLGWFGVLSTCRRCWRTAGRLQPAPAARAVCLFAPTTQPPHPSHLPNHPCLPDSIRFEGLRKALKLDERDMCMRLREVGAVTKRPPGKGSAGRVVSLLADGRTLRESLPDVKTPTKQQPRR